MLPDDGSVIRSGTWVWYCIVNLSFVPQPRTEGGKKVVIYCSSPSQGLISLEKSLQSCSNGQDLL